MDKHIFRKRKALNEDECDYLIKSFEVDKEKKGWKRPPNVYTAISLSVNQIEMVRLPLQKAVEEYIKKHPFLTVLPQWGITDEFNIQKYEVGQVYNGEHCEQGGGEDSNRCMAWMFYLNACNGGTCWPQQNYRAHPKAGDLYIWPAAWTHSHYGLPSSKEKYILTGWCEMRRDMTFVDGKVYDTKKYAPDPKKRTSLY